MKLGYTNLQRALEVLSALFLLAMLAFVIVSWGGLSDRIPTHFNGAGEIDAWGGKSSVLLIPLISVGMYVLLTAVSFFPQLWNMPVRVTEQNKWALMGLTKNLLLFMKAEILALLFYLTYCTVKAEPLSAAFLPVFLIFLFGTIGFFTLQMIRIGRQGG